MINGSAYGMGLFEQHAKLLADSAITPEHARARPYRSVDTKIRLEEIGIVKVGQHVPGLLIPLLDIEGKTWGYQYRPDNPRLNKDGKEIKYETPFRQHNRLDIPPGVGGQLDDPTIPLWFTEGSRKADAGACAGLCIVGLLGVNNWVGTNGTGGKVALPDFRDIALNGRRVILGFDSDVMVKQQVRKAMTEFAGWLKIKGAEVEYCHLPHTTDSKTGLDDYLAAAHNVEDLWALVRPDPPAVAATKGAEAYAGEQFPLAAPEPRTLIDTLEVFTRWLHLNDTAPVLAVAATIVANRAAGDPVWLLVVGPPSGGKTEVISSAAGLPYIVKAATVTEAALLSGTASRERAGNATGGLLRMVGNFGILLCKDFTSVLSQNRDTAKQAMAALREVFDGSWDRPVGTDGGRVLSWSGKCGLVGGVTPSFDRYSVITTALGDRFLLLRLADVTADKQAETALRRHDQDLQMRAELAEAMTGLIHGANLDLVGRDLTEEEEARLIALAIYTARARTAVERDGYTNEIVVIPQAEGPARLVLGLRHLYGGLEAIGADEPTRWSVVARVTRDCVPAIRHKLIGDLIGRAAPARTQDIAAAVGMVTKTAHRHLEDLALLRLADRSKAGTRDNAADLWAASEWLRSYWPDPDGPDCGTEMYVRARNALEEEDGVAPDEDTEETPDTPDTPSSTSLSYNEDDESVIGTHGTCTCCGREMRILHAGQTAHPFCKENQ